MNAPRVMGLLAAIALLIAISATSTTAQPARRLAGFFTNEEIIAGLADRSVDLADSLAVFRRVLASLPDTVEMMPSENYYYFGFYTAGRLVTGSMSLFPHERDSGMIGFGYTEKRDEHQPVRDELLGGWGTFGRAAGVTVRRVDTSAWQVATDSLSVVFRLARRFSPAGAAPRLRASEQVVLRSLDESGLAFALVLDRFERKLFWTLDESRDVPETFESIGESLVVGARTRFAFHVDSAMNRRVLVGVDGYNVLGNTWYDGPFDQIPDNDIERGAVDLLGAVRVAYPHLADRVDRFGKYHDNPSTRIAIAPYLVYFSLDELREAERVCRAESATARRRMSCLTQQVFFVPDAAYAHAR